jgi:hypothetical protein
MMKREPNPYTEVVVSHVLLGLNHCQGQDKAVAHVHARKNDLRYHWEGVGNHESREFDCMTDGRGGASEIARGHGLRAI